jgi:hypothetical protein
MTAIASSRDETRCAQCFRWKPNAEFVGARGFYVRRCAHCRQHYGRWDKKTREEKMARPRAPFPRGELRAKLHLQGGNAKLGDIPSSISSRGTCPPSCAFFENGCYAEFHLLRHHWRRVGEKGDTWPEFLASVRALPPGQLWRHNTAGDLPGRDEDLDEERLEELVRANRGRRGFTFTHRTRPENWQVIQWANLSGFTVNLSANSLEHADQLFAARAPEHAQDDLTAAGPVAVVLPFGAPVRGNRTPAGRHITVCPAQTEAHLTCETCQLCANPNRRTIIAFLAHGQDRNRVSDLVQLRRKPAAEART